MKGISSGLWPRVWRCPSPPPRGGQAERCGQREIATILALDSVPVNFNSPICPKITMAAPNIKAMLTTATIINVLSLVFIIQVDPPTRFAPYGSDAQATRFRSFPGPTDLLEPLRQRGSNRRAH